MSSTENRTVELVGRPYTPGFDQGAARYSISFSGGGIEGGTTEGFDQTQSNSSGIGNVANGEDSWSGRGRVTVENRGPPADQPEIPFDVFVDGEFQTTLQPGETFTTGERSTLDIDLEPPDNRENCQTIPLEWANTIPGVSGVNDAQICVPTPEEIAFQAAQFLIEDVGLFDRIREISEDVFADLPAPEITVDRGLFGDTVDNLEEAIQDTVAENIPELPDVQDDVSQLLDDVGSLQDTLDGLAADVSEEVTGPIEDVQSTLEELEVPTIEDIRTAIREEAEEFLEGLPDGDLLTDLDSVVDRQIERVTSGLVSDETEEELEETIERLP